MKLKPLLSLFSLTLLGAIASPPLLLAQTKPISNNWQDFGTISQQFMTGCMGKTQLPKEKLKIQENYCRCSLAAYQKRYSPQLFSKINAIAVQLGQGGSQLVSLMMEPELGQCSKTTGFKRS
ncbi:MAG: hypothetical protein ACRC6M_04295 [Microcystaceae cyanobacterium]